MGETVMISATHIVVMDYGKVFVIPERNDINLFGMNELSLMLNSDIVINKGKVIKNRWAWS